MVLSYDKILNEFIIIIIIIKLFAYDYLQKQACRISSTINKCFLSALILETSHKANNLGRFQNGRFCDFHTFDAL